MHQMVTKAAAVAILLALGGAGAGAAENPCKGLTEVACLAEKGCSWVKPGKTKEGKEKAGYCRKKPAKKAAPAPGTTPAPAQAPKT